MKTPDTIPLYGNPNYRGQCPTEAMEQATLFARLRTTKLGRLAIHPRNEGSRTHTQTALQKAQGLTPGASDVMIPGGQTFLCELKRLDHTKSKLTQDQVDYLHDAQQEGAFVCIALGADAAWEAFEQWSGKK